VNLDKDPFVVGDQTKQIEDFPFASIGVTVQGALKWEYYKNAQK
jgi:hypothetical protein